uniref:Uncharacterized protein n=1 Tax=Trichuris muris TaxID=70415 RepID=A0A5S6Q6R5_TRIMR
MQQWLQEFHIDHRELEDDPGYGQKQSLENKILKAALEANLETITKIISRHPAQMGKVRKAKNRSRLPPTVRKPSRGLWRPPTFHCDPPNESCPHCVAAEKVRQRCPFGRTGGRLAPSRGLRKSPERTSGAQVVGALSSTVCVVEPDYAQVVTVVSVIVSLVVAAVADRWSSLSLCRRLARSSLAEEPIIGITVDGVPIEKERRSFEYTCAWS